VTVKTPISKSVPGDPVNLVSDTNAVDLLPSPTVDNIDANLDNEALQWADLAAAMEKINS
jgi:hypothetical protein